MDGEEEILVRRGTDNVCGQEEFPGEEGSVPESVGAEDLQSDDEENDVFGQWLWPAKLRYLVKTVRS